MPKNKKNWVDYKEVKTQVGIQEVLERYGILGGLRRKGDNLVGRCPIHKGSNDTQFHVSLSKNNFNCFGDCHGGGNVIDLVAKLEGVDIRKAALFIQEWFMTGSERLAESGKLLASSGERVSAEGESGYGGEEELVSGRGGEERAREEKPAKAADGAVKLNKDTKTVIASAIDKKEKKGADLAGKVNANPPLKFALKNLNTEHPYLLERGLTKETIEVFGLGFCSKGMMAGRIAIPIHNHVGELVAYVGRWPGDPPEGEGKYKLPPGFKKSLELFNFHRAIEAIREVGWVILVEGLFDCMRVWQAGFKNVVALLGSQLSEEQERLVVEAVGAHGRVALMFDEDAAGWACRDEALERLVGQVYVKAIRLGDEGTQPDGMGEEEIRGVLE